MSSGSVAGGASASQIGAPVAGATATRVLFVGPGGVLADAAGFTWGPTAGQGLAVGAGTATTDVNALAISQTWNNAAVPFAALTLDVTSTASAAASHLARLRVGGVTKFSIRKDGGVWTNGGGIDISGANDPTANTIKLGYGATIAVASGNAALAIAMSGKSGSDGGASLSLTETWNTTGSPTLIKANTTNTASGAASLLLDLQVGGASQVKAAKAGGLTACAGTAIPAGGTAGSGVMVSSTANFGVFFGSGAPTLSAAKGSLYLRSDGTGVLDRAYINTDSGTTWTALTTAA